MSSKKSFILLIILTLVFTLALFFVEKVLLHPWAKEEDYIEPTLPDGYTSLEDDSYHGHDHDHSVAEVTETSTGTTNQEQSQNEPELISETLISHIDEPKEKVVFVYVPSQFQSEVVDYTKMTNTILKSESLEEKIDAVNVEFYKTLVDVRGKMKNKMIKMFGVKEMSQAEFTAVFIHEFSHYLDIYFFGNTVFGDISTRYYDISWETTKIIKKWQEQEDFVSWYAATNKYEDFAETMTYYMLHNEDFVEKAKKSAVLQKKYDFLQEYLFDDGEFQGTDFSEKNRIKSYYWDITKIDFDVNNFLQYIENEI